MKNLTKVDLHKQLCLGLNDLYAKKNHDYGDSFHQTFVEEGMAMSRIRLGDKFSRFKTLSRSTEQKVNDESIRDTLLDLANYAIMTVLEMDLEKIGEFVNQKTDSDKTDAVNEQTGSEKTEYILELTVSPAGSSVNERTDTECDGGSVNEKTGQNGGDVDA